MTLPMDKSLIVREIIKKIESDLAVMSQAAHSAHEAATEKENQGEGKYDMRAVEASYLAGAQSKRALEMQEMIRHYQQMDLRDFGGPGSTSAVSALIELESEGRHARYFLVEREGGFNVTVQGLEVQVLSVHSPLGEELVGRGPQESFEILLKNGRVRAYKLRSLS